MSLPQAEGFSFHLWKERRFYQLDLSGKCWGWWYNFYWFLPSSSSPGVTLPYSSVDSFSSLNYLNRDMGCWGTKKLVNFSLSSCLWWKYSGTEFPTDEISRKMLLVPEALIFNVLQQWDTEIVIDSKGSGQNLVRAKAHCNLRPFSSYKKIQERHLTLTFCINKASFILKGILTSQEGAY